MSLYVDGKRVCILEPFEKEETFTARQTAGGEIVVNESLAVVKKIAGKTVKTTNLIPFPYAFTSQTTNGVTATINDDGRISLSGTNSSSSRIALLIMPYTTFKPGTYTLSSGLVNENVYLHWQKRLISTGNVSVQHTKQGSAVITISEQASVECDFNLYLWIIPGANCDGITIYPMLNDGNTAKPFVPYFSGLKHSYFKAIKSTGKQLIPFPYNFTNHSENGANITTNNDGSLTIDGTPTGRVYKSIKTITLKKGTYTLSANYNDAAKAGLLLYLVDAKHTNDESKAVYLYYWKATFTVTTTTKYSLIVRLDNGATFNKYRFEPMLSIGSVEQPYEPYKVEEYGDGNTYELAEYDYIDPKAGELVRQTRTIVFDGTEEWTYNGSNDYGLHSFSFGVHPQNGGYNAIVCPLYPIRDMAFSKLQDEHIYFPGGVIYIRSLQFSTLEDWKAHLAELYANGTPLVVEYKLVTPTITPLTDYPKGYKAKNGGRETVEQGGTDNSQWGAMTKINIEYAKIYNTEVDNE